MGDRLESGVSPMVGAILVLGISVAGTAAALLLGAPALQRLQEQSALDAMLAQFGAVDEAVQSMSLVGDGRTLGLSMPSGSVRVEPGTRWLVTLGKDGDNTDCDFRVLSWADGDDRVHVTSADCRPAVTEVLFDTTCTIPLLGIALPASQACFYAYRVVGGNETPIGATQESLTEFDLAEDIRSDTDYVFRLTDRDEVVYAEAWLLHSDRLRWAGGRVGVDYDSGVLLAHGRAGDRAVTSPRVDEGLSTLGPTILVLPALRVEQGSELSGTGTRTLALALNGTYVRHAQMANGTPTPVYLARVDLVGDNAETLCETFLARDEVAPVAWQADGAGGACDTSGAQATSPATTDDTVSLRFDPEPDVVGGDSPTFSLVHMVFRVTLKP